MKSLTKIFLITLLSLAFGTPVAEAQKYKRKKTKKVKVEMHTAAYDSLLAVYDFPTLLKYLHEDIATAEKNEESTELQHSLLPVVEKANSMMQSVEKVDFIDSIVLPKSEFFKHYELSKSCGKVTSAKLLFPNLKSLPKDALCYLSDFGDIAYFPLRGKDGVKLHKSKKIAGLWQEPEPLKTNVELGEDANHPYVLSDGITLYYAAKGEASLGGYDIFVTRYDAGEEAFMAPENMGMPFNSLANDYLYVIDEHKNVGWFATDRAQKEGFVCVYKFIPKSPRQFYEPLITDDLPALARIQSIRGKKKNEMQFRDAPVANSLGEKKNDFWFPINDDLVYTSRSQFHSAKALELLQNWKDVTLRIDELQTTIMALLKLYDVAASSAQNAAEARKVGDEVKKVEQEIINSELKRDKLALDIRNEEIKALKNK